MPDAPTIRFACPTCKAAISVPQTAAGKKGVCPKCGQRLQVPASLNRTVLGVPLPERRPRSPQAEPPEIPTWMTSPPEVRRPLAAADVPLPQTEAAADAAPVPEPNYYTYDQPAPKRTGELICVAAGASLLLLGLFLPMATGPLGIGISFIDLPLKAMTVGSAIADAQPREPPTFRRTPSFGAGDEPSGGPSGGAALLGLLVVTSICYPLALAILTALSVAMVAHRRDKGATLAGLCCLGITLLFAFEILMLNGVKAARPFMLLASPGIGWAVLLIGCVVVSVAPHIGRLSRNQG